MVSSHIKAAGLHEMQLATHTQRLERAYLESLQATNTTQDLEQRRRLRLRITLLESENEDLHDHVTKCEDSTAEAVEDRENYLGKLSVAEQSLDTARNELRVKSRQVDKLQLEREGLQGQSTDSSKVLAEKVALSRELTNLKPQLEQLRSQLAVNQSAVSEKQALQRQLRAAEVELENERRSRSQGGNRSDATNQDLQARNDALESRLDTFRTKLKQTKEQLAEARKQLKKQPTEESTILAEDVQFEPEPEQRPNPKKRSFEQIEKENAIGTPGDLPNKRGKKVTTQPGEKSSFSITPFLNRTGKAPTDSPTSSPSRDRGSIAHNKAGTMKIPIAASPKAKAQPMKPRPKSLGTAAAGRNNARPPPGKRTAARSLSAPKLDKVVEEDDENQEEDAQQHSEDAALPATQAAVADTALDKPLIKKKKLLGKTIFDDDDERPMRPMSVGFLSNKAGSAGLSKTSSLQPFKFGSAAGRSVATFGAFSPLKKDRKVAAV